MKQALGIFATLLLTGCEATHSQMDLVSKPAPLNIQSTVYVAVPEPGRDEERVYEASGFQTAQAFTKAIGELGKVKMGRAVENLDAAIASARADNCNYVLIPRIQIWEDNPTEWNGEPDDLQIDAELVTVDTKETISRVLLTGKSPWASVKADKPEAMLAGMAAPYARKLFGY